MKPPRRQLHLNLFFFGVGASPGAWRLDLERSKGVRDQSFYREIAQLAEAGRFDAIFLSDNPSLLETAPFQLGQPLEPITQLAAMAAMTERIGLIGSASTTFNYPFNIARQFASLDHLSGGRAAWNIVTTSSPVAAKNFGLEEPPDHDWRYRRAFEFMEVVTKLWDSWADGAEVFDEDRGLVLDMDLVRQINHEGAEFKVRGPFSIQRLPQGYPVFFQAGTSEAGMDFAARYAEAMFVAPPNIEAARASYAEIKQRVRTAGREPSQALIFPSVTPILGDTESAAKAEAKELLELYSLEAVIQGINNGTAGIDLSKYPLDGPFPDLGPVSAFNGTQSAMMTLVETARKGNYTVRQTLEHYRERLAGKSFVGTPEQFANHMEEWFNTGAADGFMINPAHLPGALREFNEQVIPILQKRGLFREEYEGTTLRDHYGLDTPRNQFDVEDIAPRARVTA